MMFLRTRPTPFKDQVGYECCHLISFDVPYRMFLSIIHSSSSSSTFLLLFFTLFIFLRNKLYKQEQVENSFLVAQFKFLISEKVLQGCCLWISHQDGLNLGERSVTNHHRASLRSSARLRTSTEERGVVFITTVCSPPQDLNLQEIPCLVFSTELMDWTTEQEVQISSVDLEMITFWTHNEDKPAFKALIFTNYHI